MKNKKKVTLLGVAFIAAVITLAGVGYAVTHPGYQGSVSTGDVTNNYDVDYVVVKFDADHSGFVAASNFELTWNTVTIYDDSQDDDQLVTYTWQASDTLVHGLVITATDPDEDTYTLTVDVATALPDGYSLYYQLDEIETPVEKDDPNFDISDWTLYDTNATGNDRCDLMKGLVLDSGDINAVGAPNLVAFNITWVVIPDPDEIDDDDDDGEAPPAHQNVTIGGITYTVVATQGTA